MAAVPEEMASMEHVHEDVVEIGIGDLKIDDPAPSPLDGASLLSPVPPLEESVDAAPPAAPGASGQEPATSEARGPLTPAQWRTKKRAERRRVWASFHRPTHLRKPKYLRQMGRGPC